MRHLRVAAIIVVAVATFSSAVPDAFASSSSGYTVSGLGSHYDICLPYQQPASIGMLITGSSPGNASGSGSGYGSGFVTVTDGCRSYPYVLVFPAILLCLSIKHEVAYAVGVRVDDLGQPIGGYLNIKVVAPDKLTRLSSFGYSLVGISPDLTSENCGVPADLPTMTANIGGFAIVP